MFVLLLLNPIVRSIPWPTSGVTELFVAILPTEILKMVAVAVVPIFRLLPVVVVGCADGVDWTFVGFLEALKPDFRLGHIN